MDLIVHFIANIILSVVLFPFFGYYSLSTFITGFLIDVDHILFYIYRFKKLSIKGTYDYFKNYTKTHKEEYKKILRPFHNIELVVILALLSSLNIIFIPMAIALAVHLAMDYTDERRHYEKVHSFSLIKSLIK